MKYLFSFSFILLLACSGKKNLAQTKGVSIDLYRKWQLVRIESTSSEGNVTSTIDYKSKNLFVTFGKNGKMDFNYDVNGCSGSFKEAENQKLIFNPTDFVCTQACCDTIKPNYLAANRYKIDNNILILYADKEIFYFELAR